MAPITSELALAALAGDLTVVRKLLATGTPVDERVADEPTPMMMALAPYIADPGSPENREKARLARKTQIAKLLISKGADVQLADGNGMTALHRAVSSYETDRTIEELVKALLDAGASATAATCAGATPVMVAEQRGKTRLARLLRSGDADAGSEAAAP